MQELLNNVKVARVVDPGTYKSGTNPTNLLVDRQFFENAMFVFNSNTVTDAQTLTITEGDLVGGGDQANVADADLIFSKGNSDSTYFKSVLASDDNVVKKIGYKGSKRYITVACTGAGGTGAAFNVVALLGAPKHPPIA